MNYFATIHTGVSTEYPRKYIFNQYAKPDEHTKYIGMHICVRNDSACEDARILNFYYVSDPYYFASSFHIKHDVQSLLNGLWIDEWVRRRNGDYYKLYNMDVNLHPCKILEQSDNVRGNDENYFVSEEDMTKVSKDMYDSRSFIFSVDVRGEVVYGSVQMTQD